MADLLIEEVNEALRRERLHRFWRQIRVPLLLAVALLILGTAGSSIYRHHEYQEKLAVSNMMLRGIVAYNQKQYEEASEEFTKAGKVASGEMLGLPLLWQVKGLLAEGKTEEAITVLQALIAPGAATLRVRDMACLHLYALSVDAGAACAGQSASPLQAGLRLLHAAQIWQAGDVTLAKAELEALSGDATTPKEIRDMVESYLATIAASQS